ncbi:hypothetical protein K458DRAFT_437992 [Lentithecium fluviatile CBS 122367]|uniref:DUF1989 domain-containing protein n=1 Tax=Lentithecium fluviatile CBS 122367 TaxID=1168545 RepID=A0A6G1JMW1_9PLEO|nr:hypothetical protein K458DRAFT_437992 [Lentithecium fluviatile CBS 122367]
MSGELQTIPARHGVATFVPRGRTIKIINTYGKQVVSTWAFGLHAPPVEGEDAEDIEEVDELKEGLKKEEAEGKEKGGEAKKEGASKEAEKEINEEVEKPKEDAEKAKDEGKDEAQSSEEKPSEATSNDSDDPPEQAPDEPETQHAASDAKGGKRTWASYLPSLPYRSKGPTADKTSKADAKAEQEKNEATSKAWSSYLPTGKGFSSYVPNVQLPDSQGVVSAFKSSHYRDPNKSYAEQLYDFSKTPVGAGGIAAATGSGTASSIYAAYSAYTKMNPSKDSQPPMEYLSLPHTRASTHRLVPAVDDTLLTNLRNPIMTLIEDTSPGAHDTLTAACDASQYAALGVDKPEEHGSCAENLVLALKELNEKAGLKGTKAVGADITVNIAPTPLHLFMNAPIEIASSTQSEGTGAKGASLKVAEPQGKKRSYVRFRADRDIVVVLSACPMDVGSQNGGKCMAANFMVEEAKEEVEGSTASLKKTTSGSKKAAPKKLNGKKKEADDEKGSEKTEGGLKAPNVRGGLKKPAAVKASAERRDSGSDNPPESELPEEEKKETTPTPAKTADEKKEAPKPKASQQEEPKQESPNPADSKSEDPPKPKKKPKKLERRGAGTTTPAKSEQSS